MRSLFVGLGLVLCFYTPRVYSACNIDLNPEVLSTENCPRLSKSIKAHDLGELRTALSKIYYSEPVQANSKHCAKMGDLIQAICKTPLSVKSIFIEPGGDKVKSISLSTKSTDYRLKASDLVDGQIKIGGTSIAYTKYKDIVSCVQQDKSAITITPDCGMVQRCDNKLIQRSSLWGDCRSQSNTSSWSDFSKFLLSDSAAIAPVAIENLSLSTRAALIADAYYVSSPPTQAAIDYKERPPVAFCPSSSSICLQDVPLLSQGSPDLFKLVAKKTRIARPADVGFCSPTTTAMMLLGLKNQSGSPFGDAIDSGSEYNDKLLNYTSANSAGAIFRAGELTGTDWWVGGTQQNDVANTFKGNLGEASGTLQSFMKVSDGYTNENLINFFKAYGGFVQMSLAMDITGKGTCSYHSLLLAGNSGPYLRMMDPWGRSYMVSVGVQKRTARFYKLTEKAMTYWIESLKRFTFYSPAGIYGDTYSISFSSKPAVGKPFPIYSSDLVTGSSEAQLKFYSDLKAWGFVELIESEGAPVPTVQHIAGDRGFVYVAPDHQAQLLPSTELAVVNPREGVFFDAAENENVLDMLYGIGQRVRGTMWANYRIRPSDALYSTAIQYIKDNHEDVNSVLSSASYKNTIEGVTLNSIRYPSKKSVMMLGKPFSIEPFFTGGVPSLYTISPALPKGLVLNSQTGVISGTPTAPIAETSYTVSASNRANSVSTNLTLSVFSEPPKPFSVASCVSYKDSKWLYGVLSKPVGQNLNCSITLQGGFPDKVFSTPELPVGLSINTQSLSQGTFSIEGALFVVSPETTYKITVVNSLGSVSADLKIEAYKVSGVPKITYFSTSSSKGSDFSLAPKFQGGSGTPDLYSLSGILPIGLKFDTKTGLFTGKADAHGEYKFRVTAQNSSGSMTTNEFSLIIQDKMPAFTYAVTSYEFTVGKALTQTISPIHSGGVPTNCFASPPLPQGLNLSKDCVITGTPERVSIFDRFSIYASNTGGTYPLLDKLIIKIKEAVIDGECHVFPSVLRREPDSRELCKNGPVIGSVSKNTSSAGTPTFEWKCGGTNGGKEISCSAERSAPRTISEVAPGKKAEATPVLPIKVDGACKVGLIPMIGPPMRVCEKGSGANFVTKEKSYEWVCKGTDGGRDQSCSVVRLPRK